MSEREAPESDMARAEALLRASPDYRILKRIPPLATWSLGVTSDDADVRRAAFLDVETTGLDADTDEVIELAILPFDYDARTGCVLRVRPDDGLFSLREPSIPIPLEGQQVHGIRDEDVRGAVIDPTEVEAVLAPIQLVIAHNAGFDRPMVEKHWPPFEMKPWACSLNDIDWRSAGMGAGKLDYLLMRFGWFFESHRARGDAEAGAFLLTQQLPNTEATALAALLEKARTKTFLIRATGAPFEAKTLLKRRGYRWDPGASDREKAWVVVTPSPDVEIEWLRKEVFGREVNLEATLISARERYSARQFSRDSR